MEEIIVFIAYIIIIILILLTIYIVSEIIKDYFALIKIPSPKKLSQDLEKTAKKRSREIKRYLISKLKSEVKSKYEMCSKANDDIAIKFIKEDFEKSGWNLFIEKNWIFLEEMKNSENESKEPKQRIYR